MENKIISLPSGKYLMVTTKKDSRDFEIINNRLIYLAGKNGVQKLSEVLLFPGQWQIIGKASSLSESDWRGVVEVLTEQVLSITHILGYKAYNNERIWKNGYISNYPFRTALESGHSWVRSHGMEIDKCLVLKQVK